MTSTASNVTAATRSTKVSLSLWGKRLVAFSILGLTCWFMGQQIVWAWEELKTRPLTLRFNWIVLSAFFLIAGETLLSSTLYLILRDRTAAMGDPFRLSFWQVARIFWISLVGKYVPGKAVVLIIRYGLMRSIGATLWLVMLCSVYETFANVGIASWVALGLLNLPGQPMTADLSRQLPLMISTAAVFAVGFTSIVLPPVFSIVPKLVSRLAPAMVGKETAPVQWSTLGWAAINGVIGWPIVGASVWAALQAVSENDVSPSAIPIAAAAFLLSFVAGFASMVPGQLGVREVVLHTALFALVGDRLVAVSATILHRLISVVTELVMAGVLSLTLMPSSAKLPVSAEADTEPSAADGSSPNDP